MSAPVSNSVASDFFGTLAGLRLNDKLTDYTLTYDEIKFRVHKTIVCAHSRVLRNAIAGGWRESQGEYELSGHNTDWKLGDIERLIEFFYTMTYAPAVDDAEQAARGYGCSMPSAELHARMNIVADYFDVPALRKLATKRYRETLMNGVDHIEYLDSIHSVYRGGSAAENKLRLIAVEHARNVLPFKKLADDAKLKKKLESTLMYAQDFAQELAYACMTVNTSRLCAVCYKSFVPDSSGEVKCSGCTQPLHLSCNCDPGRRGGRLSKGGWPMHRVKCRGCKDGIATINYFRNWDESEEEEADGGSDDD